MKDFPFFIFFLQFFNILDCSNSLSCKSPQGYNVDWYIMYKVPDISSKYDGEYNGRQFFYMDNRRQSFVFYNTDITETSLNPLYRTLNPIYKGSRSSLSYAMYNDQPPIGNNPGRTYGHSKGVFAFDKKKNAGFWIVSSVPKFPSPSTHGYEYNDSQLTHAQMLFCITVPYSTLAIISRIFEITNPKIYDSKDFTKSETKNAVNQNIFSIETTGGTTVEVFAKSSEFGKDIYSQFIAPKTKQKLLVHTWRYESNIQDGVTDVQYICFANGPWFTYGRDHSKGAVSKNGNLACIGDLNREATQYKRGGLALCLTNEDVAKEFRHLYFNSPDEQKQKTRPKTCSNQKYKKKIRKEKKKKKIPKGRRGL